MAGRINKQLIQKEIFNNKGVKKIVRELVSKKVEKEKIIFADRFDNHPVTQELEAGETATNISGTLGGYGNLFSFLGFEQGSSPTSQIKRLIQRIVLNKNIKTVGNNKFRVQIEVPSMDDFANASPLPWERGRSWLLDMERKISGLGSYLYGRFKNSRSGTGVQRKFDYSKRSFRPVRYFTVMYNTFVRRMEKLK